MNNKNLKDYGVCIATSFYCWDPSYSLISVVESQIKMLVDIGDYKIKVLVDEQFPVDDAPDIWRHPNVTLERIPPFHKDNDGILPPDYQEQVEKLYNSLKEILKDCSVVLTHDLVLQPAEILYNLAVRRLAEERNDLHFLHMSHSATAPSVRCSDEKAREIIQQPFPGDAIMLYPNDWDRKRVSINYKYPLDRIKCVHHPIDIPEYLGFHEWTRELVKEKDLLNADIMAVYPIRLDRGKQVEFPIRILAAIKKKGRDVRLVVMDFSSTGGDKIIYREELKRIAKEEGLDDKEITFMSEWQEKTHLHSPRQMVRDLMLISNLYIHASTSETYSLTTQEAIICKNLIVLNHHFPPMRDIYGSDNIIYYPFGSAVNVLDGEDGATNININDKDKHFENIANEIIYFIENNPVLAEHTFIKKHRNLNYIFEKEFEPLLYHKKLGERN